MRGTSWVYSNRLHASRQGTTNYELTHVTDWLPTLVEAAGGDPAGPWPKPLDGVSQHGMLFEGQPSPREHLLINIERDNPTTAPCQGPGCATKLACNGVGQYAVIKVGGGRLQHAFTAANDAAYLRATLRRTAGSACLLPPSVDQHHRFPCRATISSC